MWDYAHLKPRYRRGPWARRPWWVRLFRGPVIATDPAPEYSPLDRADGLGR